MNSIDGMFDPSHPGLMVLSGVLLALLGLAIFSLRFTTTWKEWLPIWKAGLYFGGAIAGFAGFVNVLAGVKLLIIATLSS